MENQVSSTREYVYYRNCPLGIYTWTNDVFENKAEECAIREMKRLLGIVPTTYCCKKHHPRSNVYYSKKTK